MQPSNVGFYAVAKVDGKVALATGPHPASEAHRMVDEEVRPETLLRGLPFPEVGVIRMVTPVGTRLPRYSVTDGRKATT